MNPYLETYSGKQLYFLEPTEDMIELKDIPAGLSKICRYSGGINSFYSVAEHSVLLAERVLYLTGDVEQAMTALWHDCTECYLSDIPAPLKSVLPEYERIESMLMDVIFKKFNIQPITPQVHWMDKNIVRDESVLFDKPPSWQDKFEPVGVKVQCWNPVTAEDKWYDCYYTLLKMRGTNAA